MMFLCEECAKICCEQWHPTISVGVCERCNAKALCIDCQHYKKSHNEVEQDGEHVMKVESIDGFKPLRITFETQEEINLFVVLLRNIIGRYAASDKLAEFSNELLTQILQSRG